MNDSTLVAIIIARWQGTRTRHTKLFNPWPTAVARSFLHTLSFSVYSYSMKVSVFWPRNGITTANPFCSVPFVPPRFWWLSSWTVASSEKMTSLACLCCLVKMTMGELQALSLVGFADELAISTATKRPAQLFAAAQYRGGTYRNGTAVLFPFSWNHSVLQKQKLFWLILYIRWTQSFTPVLVHTTHCDYYILVSYGTLERMIPIYVVTLWLQ